MNLEITTVSHPAMPHFHASRRFRRKLRQVWHQALTGLLLATASAAALFNLLHH